MAYLKRRRKIFYVVFNTYDLNNKRVKVARSLGIKNRREANAALVKINDAEYQGKINPYDPNLDVKSYLITSYRNYSMLLSEAIPLFLNDNPHWSPGTFTVYNSVLYNFMEFAGQYLMCETRPGVSVCLNETHIKNFVFRSGISKARPNGITNSTRKKDLRHIRRFCNWLIEVNDKGLHDTRTTRNPCKGITIGKSFVDYPKKMTTTAELKKIISAFHDHQEWVKENSLFKHWKFQSWFPPLMWTYHYTGCRRGEPLFCELQHILGDFEFLRLIDQKGQKLKEVYLKPELREILSKHIETLPSQDPEQILFPNTKNNTLLQGRAVYRAFKFYLKKANLPASRTIHGMRHFSVTEDLRNGVPINFVRDQHGHSTTQITEIYEHLVNSDLKKHYELKYSK